MPEWAVYYLIVTVLVGMCCQAVTAALLVIAGGRGLAAGLRRVTGHLPVDSVVTAVCTSPDCRGRRTVHYVTGSGLQCAACRYIAA